MSRRLSCIALSLVLWAPALWADDEIPESNPFSGDAKSIREGKSWYRNTCSPCHGGRADGAGERGSGADLRKLQLGFRGFVQVVLDGRQVQGRTQGMPPWRGALKNDDVFKIAAYLETLALEGSNWKEGVKH